VDSRLQDFADKAVSYSRELGVQYCDARAEQQERKSVLLENNDTEYVRTNEDRGIGIRIIKDGVWGFFSITNPKSFEEIKNALESSVKNIINSTENKKNTIELYPNISKKIKIDFPVLKKPELDEIINIGSECSKIILEQPKIIKSIVNPWYTINSKYFVNSEGSEIQQNFTDVVIEMIATAHQSGITQSINITEGGRGGLEQIINKSQQSAKEIADKASQLTNAKPAKEEKATVVMNPDFVSLLTHEILGHPSEADRVLGKEMAWAGGAWWKNKLGKKISSENLNVFDDQDGIILTMKGWKPKKQLL
jgi:TldD protein